ncbi:retrotransposon protein, putative, ty1-copia subclass [Tanacetum coccineum]
MTVEMEKQYSLDDNTVLESFLPLSTPVTTTAGNAPGKSSYANVTSKPSGKKLNFRTLFTPGVMGLMWLSCFMDGLDAMLENGPWFIWNNPLILKKWHPDVNLLKEDVSTIPVWVKLHGVHVTVFSEDGLSVIATKLGTPLMLDSYIADMCMQSWGRSSYARAMIELRADVDFKDNIVVAMPKIAREVHYTCNIRGVEYEWKPPRCTSCKVFGHILEECLKNTVGFKPQKEYRHVPKKYNASLSGNKKKCMEPTIKVSNSNPFDVLNSVDNDVELGTNGGTTNLVNNEANSSGSYFTNVDNSSTGTTLNIDKIGKFEYLLSSGQAILVDNAGNPLKKVELPERVGFGTQSLREQWRDSYGNGDYDEDPYDDDMYEG